MTVRFEAVKVSVIIPNYNYARYVSEAVRSVLAQTHPNIEIIVVDNGSEDNSLEILKGFGNEIVLINQNNLGQSGARNSGIEKSTGVLIAFLDADDVWEPTKLEKQISHITEHTQLVYCGISRFDTDSGKILSTEMPKYKGLCALDFLENPGEAVVLCGESTVLITRELIRKVGNFDTRLSISAGWDFYRRCSLQTNFDFVPESLAKYRMHGSNMSLMSTERILDIRKSFYQMAADKESSFKFGELILGFIKLEWTFVKTLFKLNTPMKLILEFCLMPHFFGKLLFEYLKRRADGL
jgi:glycosyltransferase involved in cell wall biosynthesis